MIKYSEVVGLGAGHGFPVSFYMLLLQGPQEGGAHCAVEDKDSCLCPIGRLALDSMKI